MLKLLEKNKLSKEILKRTFRANTIISDIFSIYQILKATKKALPFKSDAEKRFLHLIDIYQNSGNNEEDTFLLQNEAEELIDYLNLFLHYQEDLENSAKNVRVESSKILTAYAKTLKGLEKTNSLIAHSKRKELIQILKVSGATEQELKGVEKVDLKDLENYVLNLAKNQSNRKVNFSSISQIQNKHSSALMKVSRSDKLNVKDPTASKFDGVKKFGNFLANQFEVFDILRDGISDLKDLLPKKDENTKSLKELIKEEEKERFNEQNKKNLEELSKDLLKSNEENSENEIEAQREIANKSDSISEQGNDLLRIGFNESSDKLEQIKDNTNQSLVVLQKTNDLLQNILQANEKALNDAELERLKDNKDGKGGKKEDEGIGPGLEDIFGGGDGIDLDVDVDRDKHRKRNKHKKPKSTKTIQKAKGGLVKKLAGTVVEGGAKVVQGLGGLASKGASAISGAGRAGLATVKGLAKFAGPVGLALTAGMALKDAYDGFDEDKANQLGFDGKTTQGKTDSAVSHALSGATFGFVDPETMAKGLQWKDELDSALVDLVGGKDSVFGKALDTMLSPMDNLSKTWDGITSWFSDDKKEKEQKQAETEKLTDSIKQLNSTQGEASVIANQLNSPSTLSNINQDNSKAISGLANPIANGFQNMFDYLSQVPGIGEFFKDKSSGKVSNNDIKKAQEFFNPLSGLLSGTGGIFSSIASTIGGIFGGGNTTNISSTGFGGGTTGGGGAGGSWENSSAGTWDSSHITGDTTKQSTELLKQFEGFQATAKWDVNHYRLGYGSDEITTKDGQVVTVTKGMTITKEDAERDLARRIPKFAQDGVVKYIGKEAWSKLNPATQSALISVAYNYGSLAKLKKLTSAAKSGDPRAIAQEIRNLAHHNNGINAKRRNKEADHIINNIGKGSDLPQAPVQSQTENIAQNAPKSTQNSVENNSNTTIPQTKNNAGNQSKHVSTGNLKKGITKVSEKQRQDIKSGKLNLKVNQEAQAMTGYDPSRRYFEAPKGSISKNDVSKLDPTLYQNLNKMAHAYQAKTGKRLIVTNSYRSYAEQKALYDSPKYKANKPGYSLHEYGLAVDIEPSQAGQLERTGMLQEFGFYRPLPNHSMEKQHVQPLSIASSELAGAGDAQLAETSKKEDETTAKAQNLPTMPKTANGLTQDSPKSSQSIATEGTSQATNLANNPIGANQSQVQNITTDNQVSTSNIASNSNSSNSSFNTVENTNINQSIATENVPNSNQAFSDLTVNSIYAKSFSTDKAEDLIPKAPSALEQRQVEDLRQMQITQSAMPNIAVSQSGGSNSSTTPIHTQSMFDDTIDDIGLAMFNKMQLG